MKLLLLIPFTLLINLSASSQYQYSVFAGPQASTVVYKVNDIKQKTGMKYGFQAGLNFKVPIEGILYFSPAVFYSLKGYQVNFNQYTYPPDADAKDNDTRIHCVELSALMQFDFNNQPGHAFIKAGPSLDFQLFGHETFNKLSGGSVSRKMKFSYSDYGHFSANILAQLGFETATGLIIFAQYSYGLANINNFDEGPVIRHRVYGLSIGKFLGKK